jgi:adhesin transport system outer membrane protein
MSVQAKCVEVMCRMRTSGVGVVFRRLCFWAFLFGSATSSAQDLASMISKTLQTHPSISAQQKQGLAASSEVDAARQQFFPTPSFSVEQVSRAQVDLQYRGDALVSVLRVQQPLWTGGRLTAGLDKAKANANVAAASMDEAQLQLSLKVLGAWSDWYGAHLRVKAHEASLLTHQRLLMQVQRRVEEGASAESELTLTQGRLAQTQILLDSARLQGQTARSKLMRWMGESLPADATPTENLRVQPRSLPDYQMQALERNPTLRRFKEQLRVLDAEVQEKRSSLYPEVSLRAEHQRGNSAIPDVPNVNRIFVSLTSKLGAGTSTWDGMRAQLQRKEALEAELQVQRLGLEEQLESDWLQYQSILTREPLVQGNLEATRRTAESWDRQFLAGRKTWQEVLNAARELLQAEVELTDLMMNKTLLKWRLALLSQGLEDSLSGNSIVVDRK